MFLLHALAAEYQLAARHRIGKYMLYISAMVK